MTVVRGRPFPPGNGGRRQGSKNKSSQLLAALLEDARPELLRKATELAKRGNVPMLKFLLARLLPRDRFVSLDLPPILSADDALKALQSILHGVSVGTVTPAEGASLAALISPFIDGIADRRSSSPSLAEHLQAPDTE